MAETPFHLATTVDDLVAARRFYGGVLGCPEGRSAATWVDFEFFGHQLSLHLGQRVEHTSDSKVDGKNVPFPHFGAVLDNADFDQLVERLVAAGVTTQAEVTDRYASQPTAQRSLFVRDPAGNALEFKAMEQGDSLYRTE
ncbi:MAG: VOC family protein [Planctomycetota bacterium]